MNQFPLFPPTAAQSASDLNGLFVLLSAVCLFYAVPVCALIVIFAFKYRHGKKNVNRGNPPRNSVPVEITWTMVPLLMGLGLFVIAARMYVRNEQAPPDSMLIYVVGKQWMWKIQHPEGRQEIDELHVPLGRDVKLVMTSQDVIHDFFIPAFRLKQDVLPDRYTSMWFRATKIGRFHLFCAEYCGTYHSRMGGWVTVMQPDEYARWLREGDAPLGMAKAGERLFIDLGCSGCHGENSRVRAPMLDGLYNGPVAIATAGGRTQVINADDRYLRDSILLPQAEIAAGYQPMMPSYKGRITEDQLLQIVEYLKNLPERSTLPRTNSGTANAGKTGDSAAANYTRSWASGAKERPAR